MGQTCKGICIQYKSPKIPNGQKYLLGHKRCSICELFITINNTRCPCCSTILRTRARN